MTLMRDLGVARIGFLLWLVITLVLALRVDLPGSGQFRRVPDERSPTVVGIIQSDFEYLDDIVQGKASVDDDPTPLDRVFQWLTKERFKCLAQDRPFWSGSIASVPGRQFGTKRYVIVCRRNCQGLRYGIVSLQAPVYHFGLSQSYPVLHVKNLLFGYDDFQWRFTRPASGPDPDISVYSWSTGAVDYGPGCKFD